MEPELSACELAAMLEAIVPNYDKFFMYEGKTVQFQNAATRFHDDWFADAPEQYGKHWLTGRVDRVAERHIIIDGKAYGYTGLEVKPL